MNRRRFFLLFILILTFPACSVDEYDKLHKDTVIKLKYLFSQGKFEEAIQVSNVISQESPLFLTPRILKLTSLFYLERYSEALLEISFIEEHISQENFSVLFFKAKILAEQKKWEDSVVIFQKLLDHDPYNFRVLYELGQLYKQVGNFRQALIFYRSALSLEFSMLKTRLEIISLYKNLGASEQAKSLRKELGLPYIQLIMQEH